jgi:hypothetical protein
VGGDFSDYLKKHKRLSEDTARSFLRQLGTRSDLGPRPRFPLSFDLSIALNCEHGTSFAPPQHRASSICTAGTLYIGT